MKYRGHLYATLAAFLLASVIILGKLILNEGIDPIVIVFFRALIAFVIMGCFLLVYDRSLLIIKARDLCFFLFYGLIVAIKYASYIYALKWTSGTITVVLLYTYPALVVILSAFIFKEKVTLNKISALVLTFLGLLLVIQIYNTSFVKYNAIGICWGLSAGLTAAIYIVMSKILTNKYNSLAVVFYGFGIGALFLFLKDPVAIMTVSLSRYSFAGILALAIFPTLLGYSLIILSYKYIEPSRTGIICTTEPVMGAIMAKIFLDEQMEIVQYFGGLMIIMGIIVMEINNVRRSYAKIKGVRGNNPEKGE